MKNTTSLFVGPSVLLLALLASCTAGTVAVDGKEWGVFHDISGHEIGVRPDSDDTGDSGDTADTGDTVTDSAETGETDTDSSPVDTGGETDETGEPVVEDTGPDDYPCADGRTEGGSGWFGRDDIAFCAAVDSSTIPSWDLGEVEGTCSVGWHVCLESEWDERNDYCESGLTRFSAVLDAEDVSIGDNDCMAHDNAEIGGWSCASDYVDPANAGTCTGRTSTAEVGKRWMVSGFSSSTIHGVACCW
jgi:hypothetical protein